MKETSFKHTNTLSKLKTQNTMSSVAAVNINTTNQEQKPRLSRDENFDHNSQNENGISLCIPHVFANISWRRIKQHIIEANLGFVERVDVIRVANKDHKRAYVHFRKNSWNMRDPTARAALKAMQDKKRIRIEYEEPWYWQVGISGSTRPDEAPKPKERKVKIDLENKTPEVVEGATSDE